MSLHLRPPLAEPASQGWVEDIAGGGLLTMQFKVTA
jgi:hypothetical protein